MLPQLLAAGKDVYDCDLVPLESLRLLEGSKPHMVWV